MAMVVVGLGNVGVSVNHNLTAVFPGVGSRWCLRLDFEIESYGGLWNAAVQKLAAQPTFAVGRTFPSRLKAKRLRIADIGVFRCRSGPVKPTRNGGCQPKADQCRRTESKITACANNLSRLPES